MQKSKFSLNIKGELLELGVPKIMGILNVTPDSFYSESRCFDEKHIVDRVNEIVSQGGDIIDIGAYSSRPDSVDISPEEEMKRLKMSLSLINREFPDSVISVDTFRADVAKMCVEEYGVAIINDISGGEIDENMFKTVAQLNVPYILMHMRGTPQTMMKNLTYDNLIEDIFRYFSRKINELRLLGVNDIIVDPGFGFSKTLDDNYRLMKHLSEFRIFDLPLLVGISRKSMIYKLLETTPQESLNGTTFLNAFALMNGADILRVHDVRQASECVKMYEMIIKQK
jgi:dihydropteroate synthase